MHQKIKSRRTFLKHTAIAGAGVAVIPGLMPKMAHARQEDTRLQGKKVLFIYGGFTKRLHIFIVMVFFHMPSWNIYMPKGTIFTI